MGQARKENRNQSRVQLDSPIRVIMGSIGAEIKYDLLTRNVSSNGFFLDFDKPGRFPFTPSSIMEIWLEIAPGNTVFFNGKMTRVVYPEDEHARDTGPGIAVRIVQISRDQDSKLREFVRQNQS